MLKPSHCPCGAWHANLNLLPFEYLWSHNTWPSPGKFHVRMKGWMGRARLLTRRPPASRPPLPMTAHPCDGFPLHTVLCHICCWEPFPSIFLSRHLSAVTFTGRCQPMFYEPVHVWCLNQSWSTATVHLEGQQLLKFGPQVNAVVHVQIVVSSGADASPSQSLAGGASVTCQPHLTNVMQHMDGASISVRQLLSALLLFITLDLLFEMKFSPLLSCN